MKKIVYLLFVLILSGCSGGFLENYPQTSVNEGGFYKSEVEYILLANGCYVPLRDFGKVDFWVVAEMPSDNVTLQTPASGGLPGRVDIDQFLATSNNENYANLWNFAYNGIFCCNKLLSEMDRPEATWSKVSYKERCIGEALFLRALYYYNLVAQFGGVPILLKAVTAAEAVDIKRSTADQIYTQIVDDLTESAVHFSKATDVEENGRANLGSANALLGKVYLTMHKYGDAEKALKAVIDSKKYDLLPNYADLFNPTKKDFKETIFAIQYSENSVELANRFIFMFAPWTSKGDITKRPAISIAASQSGWNKPTQDLINAFETGDKRKDVSIGFWTGPDYDAVVRAQPYCAKFKPPVAAPDDRCSDNFPVIRYSDVLLMYAEVLNELSRTVEALPYVQQVRNRAGLTTPLTGYNKATLEVLIAKERQVEFCFENQRWFDLKRTGKALEVMTAHGIRQKANGSYVFDDSYLITENELLAPIPVDQVLINKLEQNPGY